MLSLYEAHNARLEEQASRHQDQIHNYGHLLAETKWSEWCQGIQDPGKRALTAILLENQLQHFVDTNPRFLTETTLMSQPGIASLEQQAFPLVRSVFPNLAATELISVQPMPGPSTLIFYLQYQYGSTKGSTIAGTTLFDFPDKNYGGELIETEGVGVGDDTDAPTLTPLTYTKVRPGSVVITDGTQTVRDNGIGGFFGDISATPANSTINYVTGEVAVEWAAAVAAPTPITATYEYDSEGSTNIPQIDLILTSTPVVARDRKLRARFSMEAAAKLRRVHGLDAETEISAVMAEELKFEIDREIIDKLFSIAGSPAVTFSNSPNPGVDYNAHIQSFVNVLTAASNIVFYRTRRAQTNWIVAGMDASNIIESLPGFVPSGITSTLGVVRTGTLNGRWTVYKDPFLANQAEFLVGYKGMSWLETGMVYSPYIPLYMTPTVTLDDFVSRKGIGTSYAKKVVNPRFYVKGIITP